MRKPKIAEIGFTDNELWYTYVGLTLLKDSDKVLKKTKMEANLLAQKIYKIGILMFKWERK